MSYLKSPFKNLPELFRLSIARVLDLQIAPFSNNLLRRKRPFRISPPRVSPPFLHGLDVILVHQIFLIEKTHVDCRVRAQGSLLRTKWAYTKVERVESDRFQILLKTRES